MTSSFLESASTAASLRVRFVTGPRGRASAEASDEIAGHGRRLEQRLAGDPRDPTDEEPHLAALGCDLARVRIAIRVNRDELFRVFTHDLHAREGEGRLHPDSEERLARPGTAHPQVPMQFRLVEGGERDA